MRYKELVHFDPIITVKVLREADDPSKAREDVRTFVISDRLLEQFRSLIVEHLQFDRPADNRGLLTVANYGTGKTHLMSVISAVAEDQNALSLLTRPEAMDILRRIAGRFHVVRAEIGATQMTLRDIVCKELERGLKKLGVSFSFPPAAEVTNTKDSIEQMMEAFANVHPDRGLLFVLDEMLDFLRSRKDAELIHDLTFLREVGEICRSTRFRFIGGVQEALFDNPRFANVADAVKRVRDRFEQIRISREDVAYVVKERLLRKTAEQKDRIRGHLQQFTPLFERMAENLEDFVALFPVHPAYIRTFERIMAVEKREILKTLSREMEQLFEESVADEAPGLICYDSYRGRLAEDPSVRALPEVREVLDKSEVLRNRVEKALATRQYVPVALRIIDGLTVHRLTTEDIYTPIGATRKELRDDLCLLPPNLPERDSLFLEATIDAVIAQILRAVSGQFISENPDNTQVYLDVRKDIDYDQKIEERAASLDEERLDAAYFQALQQLLERSDAPYVSGYRIWEYELPWTDHRATRFGYLFMGAPNERSTAQPPRDFYIYFLQVYDPPEFDDEEKSDEVFFRLEKPDETFTAALRRYAGATALMGESTVTQRSVYEGKSGGALRDMVIWLRDHMGEALTATHRGKRQPLKMWLAGTAGPRRSVKEQVDTIAAKMLAPHFESRYPGYPRFLVEITRTNLQETTRHALNHVALGRKNDFSTKVLQSLQLLDMEGELTETGELARALSESLKAASGKALNRSELLTERDPGVLTWSPWHLEPIWLVVVAAVLTQLGRAEVGFPGGQVDATTLDRLTRMSLAELESFSHIAPPKPLPVVELREIAKLLSLPPGIVADHGVSDDVVRQILTKANEMLEQVVEVRAALQQGISLWGGVIVEQPDERDVRLGSLQKTLEDVRARNSVGKMNKMGLGAAGIDKARQGREELRRVKAVLDGRTHLADPAEYLREAVDVFGPDYPLSKETQGYREELLDLLRKPEIPTPSAVADFRARGEDLRRRFAEEAARAHGRDRLDASGDEKKRRILEGDLYTDLRKLASVSILPQGAFASLENQLVSVGTCKTFDERNLVRSVICPDCSYRPRVATGPSAGALVVGIEDQLRRLREDWTKTLLENLNAPEMQEQISMLTPTDGRLVMAFLDSGKLSSPIKDQFVRALNQVFQRFEVRRVSRKEVWAVLFPEQTPSTPDDLRARFERFLVELGWGVAQERLRIVPSTDDETDT